VSALLCYRYIELNPVRADMVGHPFLYPWSSYRFNAVGRSDALVKPHSIYNALGADNIARQASYRELFVGQIDVKTLSQILEMTNKCWVLGSEHFKEKIAAKVERQVEPMGRGGDRRSRHFNRV
jgi:putative transposase